MRKFRSATMAVLGVLLCLLETGNARIRVLTLPGPFGPPLIAFAAQVNAAIAAWEATNDCRDNPLFKHLLDVAKNSNRDIVIYPTKGSGRTSYLNAPIPEIGADSIVYWDPSFTAPYSTDEMVSPLTPPPRDPTSALIHELAHAAQAAEGTLPDATRPIAYGEPMSQIEQRSGTYVQNMYLRSHNLPMREHYGPYTLAPDVYLPCCSSGSACQGNCCAAGRLCSGGACSCQPGLSDCHPEQGGPCCAAGDSCNAGFQDSILDRDNRLVNGRFIPPMCCAQGTVWCGFRPDGDIRNPSQVMCCADGQICDRTRGCV